MQLILTHENADFDAIASQLAAHRLYPEATPLLPRRINRNVRQFLTLYWDAFPFMRAEDWQRRRVEEVILVDTQSFNSVRGMVKRPKVHVLDHHESRKEHKKWRYELEPLGAATTLLVEKLQASGLGLTAEEATLLLLGIYEDTGSLTYVTTTSRDARAAAWLLDQGAQLDVVQRFLDIPLTEAQRELYERLQNAAEWVQVDGQSLVVAAVVAPDDFENEISSVVHRLREALAPAGLFVLVQLGGDVQMVARSTTDSIDASLVAQELGGGGHSRAAAALIVGAALAEVHQRLVDLLPRAVKPTANVAQIMSHGVQTLPPATTVKEAAALMQRFGYEGYPVVASETGQLVGLLTRRAVDRAMSHEMAHLPVSRIMKAGQITVRPSDSIERVQQLMLAEGWGQIPVVADASPESGENGESGRPIGIVTRTDLLNFLFKPAQESTEPDMRRMLEEGLAPALWQMVLASSEAADALGMPLYFVGGLVRDLLLGNTAVDLDMVVEGDAIKLVRYLQNKYGGELHTHARFGTAKWFLSPAVWRAIAPAAGLVGVPETIDFVTARTEFYTEPSALPEVERGSIKLDLHRRDFTINTLAVRLDGAHLGELLDFYNGRRDLREGVIRVLHSLSFVDDPTRVLRAVRLEQRLGFEIEPRTAELIDTSLPMLDRVTGDRIRHEIELALVEEDPIPIMERLAELDVLAHIHPALEWLPQTAAAFRRVSDLLSDPAWHHALQNDSLAFLYFALWMTPLPRGAQTAVMARLRVRKSTREDVKSVAQLLQVLEALPADARSSEVERALRPYRPRVLLVARILKDGRPAAGQIERYYKEWRFVKSALSGNDLRDMGLEPGPQFAVLLDRLLAARLDGDVSDEAGERALLAELLQHDSSDLEG